MTTKIHKKQAWGLAVILWISALASGICLMESYENAPGQAAQAPVEWPRDSKLTLASNKLTLVLFAHPACPCTRATLRELAKLASRLGNRAEISILFSQPQTAPETWKDSDLLEAAREIPGANCRLDLNRSEAIRFHVHTSGQLLVYSSNGRLQFSGGITSGRGHEGDNPGAQHVLSLAEPANGVRSGLVGACSVYGCSLFEDTATDVRSATRN